jgi:hypothetical protein
VQTQAGELSLSTGDLMPDEKPQPETAPVPDKKKRELPEAFKAQIIKPGECKNPLGRPPGTKATRGKRLSKFSQAWGQADAPDDWFGESLKEMKKQGLTVDELIIIRIKWCLAFNVKYQNPALFKEMIDRAEGKIPLRVLTKPGDDGDDDDLEQMTSEQLEAYIADLDRRAKLTALREASKQPQLEEQTAVAMEPMPPPEEPHVG